MLSLAIGRLPEDAFAGSVEQSADLIQSLIDKAEDGDTVHIPSGSYEGRIIIDRPIQLDGGGTVTLRNTDKNSTVEITARGVALIGLIVVHEARDENAAVRISADDVRIDSMDIRTGGYGILMRKADRSFVGNTKIEWLDEDDSTASKKPKIVRRNGIDLFDSHRNVIQGNTVSNMNDGIYLESSNGNTVIGNAIDHSRYGVHCMFAKQTAVKNNHGYANVTGAMIMGVDDAVVTGNQFAKQSENVNSQGLLLFDVHTSSVEGNIVEGNRVGFYMEDSTDNVLRNNRVLRNFTGIQLLDSSNNRFSDNDFIGNVIEAEATQSKNNRLEGNYWDAYKGIDTDGDGVSNTAYVINPFFQQLTSETPAYQLFFQSPGMLFLESMFASSRDDWTSDSKPLMRPALDEGERSDNTGTDMLLFTVGAALLLVSSGIIIFLGGKRK